MSRCFRNFEAFFHEVFLRVREWWTADIEPVSGSKYDAGGRNGWTRVEMKAEDVRGKSRVLNLSVTR